MAVALTAAVGYDEGFLPVNGNVPGPWVVPFNAMLDTEVVTVIAGGLTVWQVLRGQLASNAGGHASGAIIQPLAPYPIVSTLGPSGFIAETLPREQIPETATVVCTTTHIGCQAVWLSAGQTISNISVCTSATAASVPTHYAFGLYDTLGNLCCSSADQLATAMAAQTLYTFAMVTPYKVATSGFYYVAFGFVGTTVPTLKGVARTDGTLAGTAPSLCGVTSTTYASGTLPAVIVPVAAGAVTTSWWAGLS
jgi:hypothetical protein